MSAEGVEFLKRLDPETYPSLSLIRRLALLQSLATHLDTCPAEEAEVLRAARERAIDASVEAYLDDHPYLKLNNEIDHQG